MFGGRTNFESLLLMGLLRPPLSKVGAIDLRSK